MQQGWSFLVCCCLILPCVQAAFATKTVTDITSLLTSVWAEPVGLAEGAQLSLLWRFDDSSTPWAGFTLLLVDSEQLARYYKVSTDTQQEYVSIVCLSPSALRVQLPQDAQAGLVTFTVRYTEQYKLLLLHCSRPDDGSLNLQVNSTTTMMHGAFVHRLALEDIPLPNVYFGLLLACLGLLVAWVFELLSLRGRHVTGLHAACTVALLFKAIEMGLQLLYYRTIDDTGQAPAPLRVTNILMQKMSLLSQMAVMFLISLGWKVTRAHLTTREIRLLSVAFGLYLCFSGSQAGCEGNSSDDKMCSAYILTEYVTHSLILLGIIVSINFNITHLRAGLNDYPWSAAVPLQYASLKAYQFFRWSFLLYLLLPTILLIARIMLLSWSYSWLSTAMKEAAYLAIYVCIAVTFSPRSRDLYTRPFAPVERQEDGGAEGQQEQQQQQGQQQQQQQVRQAQQPVHPAPG